MNLTFSELSLVLLVGPAGCGKSTFARRHFRPTEVVSSDFFRGLVCDDENNQAASRDAFELLHEVVARRLAWRRFTVVDATNLQRHALQLGPDAGSVERVERTGTQGRPGDARQQGEHAVDVHRVGLDQPMAEKMKPEIDVVHVDGLVGQGHDLRPDRHDLDLPNVVPVGVAGEVIGGMAGQ